MAEAKTTYVHFSTPDHRRNRRDGGDRKTLRLRRSRSGRATPCRSVEFTGTGRVVYSPERPLPCGAVAWVEIEGVVTPL